MNGDKGALNGQREHWQRTFVSEPEMFGAEPSYAARQAAGGFPQEGQKRILELGSGQGRDTLFFLRSGFEVCALDYSGPGLEAIRQKAEGAGLGSRLKTVEHDVRQPLPFGADGFEGCFAHMLFCMALTRRELAGLAREVWRVLEPGALCVYTVRNVEDPHYGVGVHHGEGLYEVPGGFVVHFFDRGLVEELAAGYKVCRVEAFEEGELPRRLWLVTQRKEH